MASSHSAGAARDTRVDDLDRFMERAIEAEAVCRDALAATLYARAENLATQLHPDDDTCLVPAWLRCTRVSSLFQHAILVRKAEGTPREGVGKHETTAALEAQAWQLLLGVVAVIERRAAAGTTVRSKRKARESRIACVESTRSPLLRPVAEVWHVPQRGGGILQALAGGCGWPTCHLPISRRSITSSWQRSRNLDGRRRIWWTVLYCVLR